MGLYAVTILAGSLDAATRLRAMELDLHERSARRRPETGEIAVPGVLDDADIARVRTAGYTVQINQDLEQVAAERAAEVQPSVNRMAPNLRAATGDATNSKEADVSALEMLFDLSDVGTAGNAPEVRAVLGGYLTPEEIESSIQALAAAHPGKAEVVGLPELSWEQRASHALRIRAGTGAQRVGVLLTGCMHAREWGGADICLAFATNLLKSHAAGTSLKYGSKTFSAAQVKTILERLDIIILPNVNPDGKAFSQGNDPLASGPQGTWWRKNRNPNPGLAARGVDLNRNFDFLWSSGIGTSTSATSFTYRGKHAFSEPESRNIRHLLDTFPNIAFYVDVHSHGELILFPWGDDDNQGNKPAQNFQNPAFAGVRGQPGDTAYREFIPVADQAMLRTLAKNMNTALKTVRGRSYTVQQAVGLYPTSATSDDYIFSRHRADPTKTKVYGFTVEFGTEFVPPYAEMRNIIADVSAALTELCRAATAP
ncbi:MAG: M14 family metallopeptidase [Chloroflexota bacterium]